MFIAIEGIEGSGKSTLAFGLAQALRSRGHDVLETREPGGTELGEAVREIFLRSSTAIMPLSECLLFNAARAQHVATLIRPALEARRVVVCDRFTDSTLAYQGYGRGIDLELLRDLCEIATGGVRPDLTLLLDVPVSVSRDRLAQRSGETRDRFESEADEFLERVRKGYLEVSRSPDHRVLDAMLAPERLLEQSLQAIDAAARAGVS